MIQLTKPLQGLVETFDQPGTPKVLAEGRAKRDLLLSDEDASMLDERIKSADAASVCPNIRKGGSVHRDRAEQDSESTSKVLASSHS